MISGILLLLVEDEALIRLHLEEELRDAGFELVIATDGAQAMTEIETDAARFRGVVTDIRLGAGPNGWEIARRARELVAGIPVVYMSGDSAHEWGAQGVPESVMVAKPFVTVQVITAISTLLNEAGPC
jgi:DNA-binding response OmpR family regulator